MEFLCPIYVFMTISSPVIYYDPNKCVLGGRCVRACQEISGLSNLGFVRKGDQTVVVAGLNTEINQNACAACMACVNVCPPGALNEKVVYFSGTDWTPSPKIHVIVTYYPLSYLP
jgi:NADP-reducing hydrogenase subunit HndD